MDRRAYHRLRARRMRYQHWLTLHQTRDTCTKRFGKYTTCGGPIKEREVEGGRVRLCLFCVLKDAGLCRDCLCPVDGTIGKALRCEDCRREHLKGLTNAWRAEHRDKVNARSRERAKVWRESDDARRRRKIERQRMRRLADPDTTREKKRRRKATEHAKARRRERYAQEAASRRAVERERAARQREGLPFTHPCVTCGRPIAGRAKKCEPCQRRAQADALNWFGRVG